jgi:BirA family biotin operon repressor/biotin-[acetyl-CoA-carboxylase] ligase
MTYIHKKVVSSTQKELLMHIDAFPHLTVLSAGYQTEGHGQFDRVWESEKDQNVLCSILIKDISTEKLIHLQRDIALIIVDILKNYMSDVTFKEPNDILVKKNKIAGVIVESKTRNQNVLGAVIGFGVNINQTVFSTLNVTSMKLECQTSFDLIEIEKIILEKILAFI